jgi:hypothetical protein
VCRTGPCNVGIYSAWTNSSVFSIHKFLFQCKLPEDDQKKFETCRSVSKLHLKLYILKFVQLLVLLLNCSLMHYYYYHSHAPHNDVSVNDGLHIRRWSHNIIT